MYASPVRFGEAVARSAPPPWAVVTVKCCVIGLLTLPLAMPILLGASMALETGTDLFRKVALISSVLVWVGMFACAQVLTTVYPPVRRR